MPDNHPDTLLLQVIDAQNSIATFVRALLAENQTLRQRVFELEEAAKRVIPAEKEPEHG